MEDAKTWPNAAKYKGGLESKGLFAGSMCGGGDLLRPGHHEGQGRLLRPGRAGLERRPVDRRRRRRARASTSPAAAPAAPGIRWRRTTRSCSASVQGRNPASDNYFDQGQAKLVYDIDISPLIKSAQDGEVDCDLSRGIHKGGAEPHRHPALQQAGPGREGRRLPDADLGAAGQRHHQRRPALGRAGQPHARPERRAVAPDVLELLRLEDGRRRRPPLLQRGRRARRQAQLRRGLPRREDGRARRELQPPQLARQPGCGLLQAALGDLGLPAGHLPERRRSARAVRGVPHVAA